MSVRLAAMLAPHVACVGRPRAQQSPAPRLASVRRCGATPRAARSVRAAAVPLSLQLSAGVLHSIPNAIASVAVAPVAVPALNAASTVWLLVCSAGILAMNLPGLCMFYGGMLDSRNGACLRGACRT